MAHAHATWNGHGKDEQKQGRPPRWVGRLGRFGFAAAGIAYAMFGGIAVKVALFGGNAPSKTRIVRSLADEAWGVLLLLGLAAGFAGYALWLAASAFFGETAEGARERGGWRRAGAALRALVYAAGAGGALAIMFTAWRPRSEERTTATLLGAPGGRWLVLAAALVFLGAAVFNAWFGLSRRFSDRLKDGEMSETIRRAVLGVGVFGHVARAVVFGLIGAFLARAAITFDPQKAVGLEESLRKLVVDGSGSWLLLVVAAGLFAFGVFRLLEARYRRV